MRLSCVCVVIDTSYVQYIPGTWYVVVFLGWQAVIVGFSRRE